MTAPVLIETRHHPRGMLGRFQAWPDRRVLVQHPADHRATSAELLRLFGLMERPFTIDAQTEEGCGDHLFLIWKLSIEPARDVVRCLPCDGTGQRLLLESRVPCDDCLGLGAWPEGIATPKPPKPGTYRLSRCADGVHCAWMTVKLDDPPEKSWKDVAPSDAFNKVNDPTPRPIVNWDLERFRREADAACAIQTERLGALRALLKAALLGSGPDPEVAAQSLAEDLTRLAGRLVVTLAISPEDFPEGAIPTERGLKVQAALADELARHAMRWAVQTRLQRLDLTARLPLSFRRPPAGGPAGNDRPSRSKRV